MTTTSQTAVGAMRESAPAPKVHSLTLKIGRFLLHLVEMTIAMVLGMMLFNVLIDQIPAWSSYRAAFRSGTALYIIADGLFMVTPMVTWMLIRGHDRRLSLEMGASMLVPGLAIIVLRMLGSDTYIPWLPEFACPLMCLGMVIYMLFRYDHFIGSGSHSAAPAGEPTCH